VTLPWILALAASALVASDDPALESLRLPCQRFTLGNGLQVVLHEDRRSPLVALHLLVRVGSADDPAGAPGAAHLLEHMMFEGSANAPGQAYDLLLGQAGGDANAWTDRDLTAYQVLLSPGALERALYLESDRLGWLSLDPQRLAVQRSVVLEERAQLLDTPHGADALQLARALYPTGHPYHGHVMGSPLEEGGAELRGADREALVAFFEGRYAPQRCSLVLAGDLDPQAAEALVRRWFADLPARKTAPRAVAELPALEGELRRLHLADAADRTLYLAWRGPPEGHADEAALAVASWLLAGGRGSRLHQALVAGGHAEQVGGWSDSRRLGGEWVLSVSTPRGRLAPLLRRCDAELEALRLEGPDEEELARARSAWLGSWLRALEPLDRRAELLNRCLALTGEPDCLAQELDRYLAVDGEELRGALERWVVPERRVLLSVVSPGAADAALPGSESMEGP